MAQLIDTTVDGDLNVTGITTLNTIDSSTRQMLADVFYPVGALYISYESTSPAELFGGTWLEIAGVFPYFNSGTETGGNNTHTLIEGEMPTHRHKSLRYTTSKVASGSAWMAVFGAESSNGESQNYTSAVGGSAAHNNMPAYQTFYAWRRTA